MKIIKVIVIMSCVFFMIGGVSADEQRVEANFTALEANEINSQYMPRPTFAKITTPNGGSKLAIKFEMDGYGSNSANFEVASEFVEENIEAINKYLKWATMAVERGDMLDKEVAVVRGTDVGPFFVWNNYQFHSGNKKSHYLIISVGTKVFGMFSRNEKMSVGSITLDEENAKRLIDRLLEFKEGNYTKTKESDYN